MLISKELYLDRPLSSGFFPVVIRVSHLGKEKIIPTSVCCHRKHWDNQLNSVNRRDVAYSIKNNQIDALYRRIAGKIQDYLDKTLSDNLDNILDSKEIAGKSVIKEHGLTNTDKNDNSEKFADLIRQKIQSISTLNTRRGYECFLRFFLKRFGEGPNLNELSQGFFDLFRKVIERDYPVKSTMRNIHTAHMNAVVNFGKENGSVSKDLSVKMPVYSMLHSGRDISKTEIAGIFKLLKKEMKRDPLLNQSTTLSLALFMLNIAFQGLSPTDFARLKVGDISFTTLSLYNKECPGRRKDSKEEVVMVNTYRQKTKQPVKIVAVSTPVKEILKALMKGKNSEDFLLPCFKSERDYTADQRQNRLANFFNKMSRVMNSELRKNGILFTRTKITFYFARHAFCNLVDSLDIPRHLIQYLIGHRVSVLERNYLRQISSSEQAAISKRLFSLIS